MISSRVCVINKLTKRPDVTPSSEVSRSCYKKIKTELKSSFFLTEAQMLNN